MLPPFLVLLAPRWWGWRNQLRRGGREVALKSASLAAIAAGFWVGVFLVFARVLRYFQAVEELGDILAYKLLAMVFVTFFGLLVFSNVLVALNTFFLSQDLPTIHATPTPLGDFFAARFTETLLESSWMVLLFGIPIFAAYARVYGAGCKYYLTVASVLVPYLVLAAAIGVALTLVLVQIVPAQRTRDILLLLSVVVVVLLYVLFRFSRPERLVDPDSFSSIITYFRALATPASPLLPSTWATEAIWPTLRPSPVASGFYQGFLWWTAAAAVTCTCFLGGLIYPGGWSKAQETRRMAVGRVLRRLLGADEQSPGHHGQVGALMSKDFKTFFRDNSQWSQLLLIAALVVVYLYNYSVLPLERARMPTIYLQNLIGFLNIGLAGFVLAAIGVRFLFPAVSSEGFSFWIVQSGPLSLQTLLWSKFFFYLAPLLLLGQVLAVASNILLGVEPLMRWLAPLTVLLLTFGITGLGIGLGAAFPNFKAENLSQVATGFGGLLYMLIAMSYIGVIVVLEAGPVYTLFMAQIRGRPLSGWDWGYIVACFCLALVAHGLATWLPMRYGWRRLAAYEG